MSTVETFGNKADDIIKAQAMRVVSCDKYKPITFLIEDGLTLDHSVGLKQGWATMERVHSAVAYLIWP